MSAAVRRIAALLMASLFLASPALVAAHAFLPCLLMVREIGAGRYEVVWKIPPETAETGERAAAPSPVFPAQCRRLEKPGASEDGRGGVDRFTIDCGAEGLGGSPIEVAGLSAAKMDAVVRFTRKDGETSTFVLREGSPSVVIAQRPGADRPHFTSRLACARTYLGAGLEHILRGFDHLLFVFGLLLLVKRRGDARYAATLVRTITAFTAAHSVTLAMAALGLVRVPPAPVEAMIALSIFFLAVELVRPEGGAEPRRPPWVVAFAFGLFHGFGFAGALSNLGLPPEEIPLSLLMFNLGVEAGQLGFVLVMVIGQRLAASAAARAPRWAAKGPAYLLGSLAAYLCLERVAAFFA